MNVLCVSVFVCLKDGEQTLREKSNRPSVVSDELVQKIYEKVHENQWFTISELSEFPYISWTVLYSPDLGLSSFGLSEL